MPFRLTINLQNSDSFEYILRVGTWYISLKQANSHHKKTHIKMYINNC